MRPIRSIATVLLIAGVAVASCARSQPDQRDTTTGQPPAITAPPATTTPPTAPAPEPVVLADGRHPVDLKSIDLGRRTITFDLIQLYWGDEATREAAKDHQESPPPNDYYIRNVSPKLRTLPVRANAIVTVNRFVNGLKNVPLSFAELPALLRGQPYASRLFYITVHHDQVMRMDQQFIP